VEIKASVNQVRQERVTNTVLIVEWGFALRAMETRCLEGLSIMLTTA
jgi:hypothetical protein